MKEGFSRNCPRALPAGSKKDGPDLRRNRHSLHVDNTAEDRSLDRFGAKYDAFDGILKKVSDMKLDGSLDSEGPSTESERSSSTKPCARSGGSSFEDESSAGSIASSEHRLPCEEIPRVRLNRRSCVAAPASAPQPPSSTASTLPRSGFFFSPSPTDLRLSSAEDKQIGRTNFPDPSKSSVCREERRLFACDADYDRASFRRETPPPEESGHPETIGETEKHQLEMFFKSLKSEVFVCGSLANLYFGWKEKEGSWTYRHTGAVVVILDKGDARSRRKRRIQILLAERGTCFPLWKDTIDNLSAYRKSGTAFHTMHVSSDHRQVVGFSFDSPREAERLIRHVEDLTSNPENINISVPGSKRGKKVPPKKKPQPLPHKKQISKPCLFQHVTAVAAGDKAAYASLRALIDDEAASKRDAAARGLDGR